MCAWRLAYRWYGWRGPAWRDIDAIVRRESGWDPCAVNPGLHECGYRGSSACGIPQAYPCSKTWWGRSGDLYGTRYWQVKWMLRYIHDGYGTPANALYHERTSYY